LPENVPLYMDMRVKDFLNFATRVKGVSGTASKKQIDLVLEECSLRHVADRYIKTLSKGYKQRVGLAQALIGEPEILILDEPTIGLDPNQIVEIRSLIKKMAGKKTVILSSHILPEVKMISDRIIIINNGEIVATDTPDNLDNRLQSAREISLVVDGDEETVLGLIQRVPNVLTVLVSNQTREGTEYIVSSLKDKDVRADLAYAIVRSRKKCSLLEMKTISMSLEDIFMKLVTKEK